MAFWVHFTPEDYNENAFGLIPAGNHRVRIENTEDQTSKNGKSMVKITLAVSGYNTKLWYYLVLDDSTPEAIRQTNQRLGSFWNCFNIQFDNMNSQDWIGHVGGVKVRHTKDQENNDRADVHYFLKRSEVDRLPAWQEGSSPSPTVQENHDNSLQGSDVFNPFVNEDTASLPF